MGFTINKKKQGGLSILEALISTAIVGIGFVAIFQMVNYSVQSIDVSGERTKANYIVSMIAEDMIGNKDTLHGVDPGNENITWSLGVAVDKNDPNKSYKKFSEHLMDEPWNIDGCADSSGFRRASDITDIYGGSATDAPTNKKNKWNLVIGTDRVLKCKSEKDIKRVRVFKLCRWSSCSLKSENVFDEALFITRVQINLNDGKKRKFLYFQNDYKLKD